MVTYLPRLTDPLLGELVEAFPAILLLGPRGIGKTTTAARHAASTVRLDRPEDAAAFSAAPDATLASAGSGERPLLIDEWQEVPEVLGAIKRSVDRDRSPGQFLLTGSVRARRTAATWPATGRVITVDMYGLTVAEQQGLPRSGPDVLTRLRSGVADALTVPRNPPELYDYLALALRGGYPEALFVPAQQRRRWYSSYLGELINRDAVEVAGIRDAVLARRVFDALALNTAGTPTISALAEFSGADVRTVQGYARLFEDLRVTTQAPAWHHNRLTRLVKTPKYYVLDSGLAAAAAGVNRDALSRNADLRGRLLDTFVAAQIRPHLSLLEDEAGLYHLRQQDGRREIDMLVEFATGDVLAIEVKASSAVDVRAAKHLTWLRDELGDQFLAGVMFYTGKHVVQLGERIVAAPICCLWS